MKISYAQINPRLGDFEGNLDQITSAMKAALAEGVDLLVFPEASLCGYPANDLLDWPEFVFEQRKILNKVHRAVPEGLTVLVGLFTLNPDRRGRPYLNSVAVLARKKKPTYVHKAILPVGDVFDEGRYFQEYRKKQNRVITIRGIRVLISICEEMWAWDHPKRRNFHLDNPFSEWRGRKVDLVVNMSASPFHLGKHEERLFMARQVVKFLKAPLLYVNRIGSQDEVLFDGRSLIMNSKGQVIFTAPAFEPSQQSFDIAGFDSSRPLSKVEPSHRDELLWRALVSGIRQFLAAARISKVHLGVSGGVDSALVAALAVEAVGSKNVVGVALPTEFNSPDSLSLSRDLSRRLEIELVEFPIQQIYASVRSSLDKTFGISGFGLVHENLQARLRGLLLMAYSNHTGSLLLATSNKSELAVGYSTLYGDLCGGLAPIGDLTKENVYRLCRWRNQEQEVIPKGILERAPSAELRPGQKDSDSLPEYDRLDLLVEKWIQQEPSRAATSEESWFVRQLLRNEFKRWQAPPVLKVTSRAFGKGRRWPIALHWSPIKNRSSK